jgi:hypothetical protein
MKTQQIKIFMRREMKRKRSKRKKKKSLTLEKEI